MDSTHPLRDWITANTTQAKFARLVECSEPHLSDVLSWKKDPSLDLADRMSAATGRTVPVAAFVRRPAEAAQ